MGNDFSKGVDSAVSIIIGIITGDMTGGLAGASAPWLAEQIKLHTGHLDKDGKWQTDDIASNLIAHAILGAVVAELQGNSALSGGVGAVSGELASKVIINTLYGGKDASELTEDEKQTISALSQLAAGLAVAAGGGSVGDAGAAISSSKNAVENNGLAKPILKGLEKGYEFCMKNATCRNMLAQLGVDFGLTNDQIQEAMDAGKSRDPEKIKELSPEQVAWLDAQILAKKGLAPTMFGNETWGDKIYNESSNNELNNSEATAVGGAPILPPDDDNNKNENNQKQRQQERFDELKDVFDKDNPKTDLKIDGQTIQQGPGSNRYTTRIYESQNLTDRQIYNYAEELAGQPLTKTRDGIYTAKLQDGTTITLRNVSSSVDKTGARWTIDIRNNPTLTNLYRGLRKSAEIKFR